MFYFNLNTFLMKKVFPVIYALLMAFTLTAQEKVDEDIIQLIRKHGLEQSQVMDHASWMTDVYGPRLTASPMLDKATDWAIGRLESWGMANVHRDEWGPFGRGWELEHFELHAMSKGYWPVLGYPKAWSASQTGSGDVIYLSAQTEEELKAYEGKLSGKFVMLDTIRDIEPWFDPLARRHDAESLLRLANAGAPTPRPRREFARRGPQGFNAAMWELIEKERPLAVLDRSFKGDLGTIFISGARATGDGSVRDDGVYVVPQVTLAVEHYNRIMRMLDKGISTTLTMDMRVRYFEGDGMQHNIIADIPGTDLADELVMFGAHFDSWHTGTGATDNAAGSAVMMEVARILLETIRESGIQPRRTLRLALWTGEEQGLLGSRRHVGKYYADFAPGGFTPETIRPESEKVSVYFNLDNGTGKIRGIYTQGNEAVVPIFRAWLEPFADLDASTITLSNTGGTDHLAFDGIGIPGFQFIQEPMAYSSRTHHSNMDNYDHLVADDLRQAATIIAAFAWHAAQRDEKLPRKTVDVIR